MITLFSLSILLEDCECAALSCNLYGYVVFMLFGMSGIIKSSRLKRLQFTIWLINLNYIRGDG
jgi:hypothetical protein